MAWLVSPSAVMRAFSLQRSSNRRTEKSKCVMKLMTEPRQMRHRCPIRETILVMCTQGRSHAIAHDIENFGELLGDP